MTTCWQVSRLLLPEQDISELMDRIKTLFPQLWAGRGLIHVKARRTLPSILLDWHQKIEVQT
jgi:hypothetical protein